MAERAPGPVRLQIINGTEHRTSRWHLEITDEHAGHRLAQVLQEVELRAAAAEARDRERLEYDRQRRQRFAAVIVEARAAYMDDYRAKTLIGQVDQWPLAQRIDAYLTALEAANAERGNDEQITAWIAWARDYRQRIDLLNHRLEIPVEHTPDLETLKQYLPKNLNLHPFL